MIEENADGEIHALDERFAYILIKVTVEWQKNKLCTLDYYKRILSKKYAEYLINFNKEAVLKILIDYIMFSPTYETHTFIYLPSYYFSCIADFSSIALKFPRAEKDNLTNETNND